MNSVLKVIKITTDSSNAISKVLMAGHEGLLERDSDSVKQKISTTYDFFNTLSGAKFWNWGMQHAATHEKIAKEIPNYDQHDSDGCSEQLYSYTLDKIPRTQGRARKVLEVGCGGGAGLNFLARLEGRSEFVGLDLSPHAIDRANAAYARPGSLSYVQGDAEHLPFQDGEFDEIINVESSHNYPNLGKFFAEVARVLRPGGYFSLVDVFTDHRHLAMEKCKLQSKEQLTWIEENDITDYVKASIRKRMEPNSVFIKRLKASMPWSMRPVAKLMFGSTFAKDARTSADGFLPKLLERRNDRPASLEKQLNRYSHMLARKAE